MIYLHTGQPGAGKTLFTIAHLMEVSEKEQRPVYYNGITDCKVPGWIELEKAEEWHKLPAGAIIVIDEAQRVFRPRGNGSAVPEHVEKLETHRHLGVDIYVITQHPMLLDSNLRRLVGLHRHVMRMFGTKAAKVHEWQQVKDQCDKTRKDSVSRTFRYPPKVFELYKSAERHTHKSRIPPRVFFLLAMPFLVAACCWYLWHWMQAKQKPATQAAQVVGTANAPGASGVPAGVQSQGVGWFDARQPRVATLAHTAPVYDEVTKPVRAPYPAACVASKSRCQCYTQQGTKLGVEEGLCRSIAADGFFVAWEDRAAGGEGAHRDTAPAAVPVVADQAPVIIAAPPRWRDGSNGISGGKG